jgi:type II secretory pathway pseudopilin PulG
MSTRKKPRNFIQRLFRAIWRFFDGITKSFISWLLRSLLLLQRRSRLNQAGFVLPTVIMVILVVILLTTAIMIRSFDRSKNASNYRVNETVLNAASPALDRARAKLEYLFSPSEPNLKGNTPDETSIAQAFENPKYTFGDETPLKVVYDSNGDGKIEPEDPNSPQIPSPEKLKTAWKFPVDTDNNGKFDSFTIYGIYYRTPDTERARGALEARARPQLTGAQNECTAGNGGGGAADEDNGWYDVGNGQLKKAFFTYVATVPITQKPTAPYKGNVPVAQFESYKGNKGFSALEMQQDQARLSLDNNAVWYEDDLIITEVPQEGFRLNGRVQVNGNLMLGSSGNFTGPIIFYQVSSPWSCFYNAENARIVVGGNVSANGIAGNTNTTDLGNTNVQVHLFDAPRQDFDPAKTKNVNSDNITTTQPPREVAYNTRAYAQRLNVLVQGGLSEYDAVNNGAAPTPGTAGTVAKVTRFPKEISTQFDDKYPKTPLDPTGARNLLSQVLESYFKQRIRKVPYAEVPIDKPKLALQAGGADVSGNPSGGGTYVFSTLGPDGKILPPEKWMEIEDPNSHSPNGYTELALKYGPGNTQQLEQTNPDDIPTIGTQYNIGDRMYVGNGLPNAWWDGKTQKFAAPGAAQAAYNGGTQVNWNDKGGGDSGKNRTRTSQTKILEDLGDTSRNGFWEQAAADPNNLSKDKELAGGLRVITGAGIYVDDTLPAIGGTGKHQPENLANKVINPLQKPASFLPTPPVTPAQLKAVNAEIQPNNPLKPVSVVWPDLMPMYYWKDKPNGGVAGTPEANEVLKGDLQMRATVVYHYNNPNNPDQPIACISSYYDPTNPDTAKNKNGLPGGDPKGASNNGVSYAPPTARVVTPRLRRQAYMVFPDGRWVNKPLQDAIEALQAGKDLSLEQKAAIDAANCALNILDGAAPSASPVPDGAIRERAFLDARQVKTVHKPDYVFNSDGLTFTVDPTLEIDRETVQKDADGKVLIADSEQMKIATQYTLNKSQKTLSEYSLPIEQRQPLEIRVTEIDVEQLRTVKFGPPKNGSDEYLLPLSGIVYASRDDALPDITDVNTSAKFPKLRVDGGGSATDFKLDPTRRPNGIRLISSDPNGGGRLSRGTTNQYTPEEKGLILATNLPVYIKGNFNLHYRFDTTTPTEEFNDKLDANYNNFYDRGKGQNKPFDFQFACRQGSKKGCNVGDQWRAARILSDAITLLSNSFRDGFRSEGDYDLNNNGGNSLVAARLKNGFWWNGFATNYLYQDAGGAVQLSPDTAKFAEQDEKNLQDGSSYAMNGVTPIQRREKFPQYLMEACTKLPVSECSPQDWFVGGPNNNLRKASAIIGQALPAQNPSGTTAQPPTGIFQSSARRVAFQRDDKFGQLVLPDSCTANPGNPNNANCDAIPIGVDGTGKPAQYGYKLAGGPAAAVPPDADNALWYWTTSDITNADPSTAAPSYDKKNLLYYLPDDPETVTSPTVPTERQMLLPGVPKFPFDLSDAANPYNINAFSFNGVGILNGNTQDDPSDYSVCIKGFYSKSYKVANFNPGAVPPCDQSKVKEMYTALLNPALVTNATYSTTVSALTVPTTPPTPPATSTPVELKASSKVNFFDLSSNNLKTLTLNFRRNGQPDPIFVIRGAPGVAAAMTFDNVTVNLDGVDPNNIFWVSRLGTWIKSGELVGNFIGGLGRLRIDDGTVIKGGRFLGFTPPGALTNILTTGKMTALTTTAQPLLVPVLQLHSPLGSPGDTPFKRSTQAQDRKWLQKATATNYNAALIMGDTPARPFPSGGGENNGGLHNFPRFIENWAGQAATIRGSLIQYIKSKYATGPFDAVDLVNKDNSLFFDGPVAPYIAAQPPNDANPPGYQYFEAAALSKAPYYQPPGRKWGYDVGFLSQTPDLFSRRFAIPSAGTPNEFFREVAKDDPWISGLLCAAEKQSTPGGGGAYEWAIADPKQRPTSCRPLTDYTDPS